MLTCLPVFICSWNFRVVADDRQVGVLTFNQLTEQGTLRYADQEYAIRKHGPFSGRWTVEDGSEVLIEATKPSSLFREFNIKSSSVEFSAKAQNPFGRSFDLISGDATIGTIYPRHMFTRRAEIVCDASVPEFEQLFAFWLVVLTWKRAAKRDSVANSAH
jgi:hypothetical protein